MYKGYVAAYVAVYKDETSTTILIFISILASLPPVIQCEQPDGRGPGEGNYKWNIYMNHIYMISECGYIRIYG